MGQGMCGIVRFGPLSLRSAPHLSALLRRSQCSEGFYFPASSAFVNSTFLSGVWPLLAPCVRFSHLVFFCRRLVFLPVPPFPVHAFMPFPFGSSILRPSLSIYRDGSGYVRDRSFRTFVVTISSSTLCLITAFSMLCGFLLSRLLGVRQFDVLSESVAAPRSVS
jgi:hypothetical protein